MNREANESILNISHINSSVTILPLCIVNITEVNIAFRKPFHANSHNTKTITSNGLYIISSANSHSITNSQKSARRLIPLFDRVLIKKIVQESEKKIGSIYVPDTIAKNQNHEGEVVAVGNGIEDKKMLLKVGDKVLLPSYDGQKTNFDGKEYFMFREDEIIAKIE
jgi:chaperonin GroES